MTIAILNILLILFYFLFNIRKGIRIFSPFLYPFFSFALSYSIPLIVYHVIYKEKIYENAILVQNLGIVSFFVGVLLYYILTRKKEQLDLTNTYSTIHKTTAWLFLFIGISLMLFYGFYTNMIILILQNKDVEDLRRKVEIGLGIIKTPAIFFIQFSIGILFAYRIVRKKSIITFLIFILLFILLIFLSTGHRGPALFLIPFCLAIYNKYKKISVIKLTILVLILMSIAMGMGSLRRGGGINNIISKPLNYLIYQSIIYRINFVRMVDLVDNKIVTLLYGKEYISDATYIIPRVIWKKKPLGFDYFYKEKLGYRFAGGGTPVGVFGSLYANFWYPGVIIGSFLIGVLYSLFYRRYIYSNNITYSIIYFLNMIYIIDVSSLLRNLEILFIFYFSMLFVDQLLFFSKRGIRRTK